MDAITIKLVLGILLSYILGSIPTAYIFGRAAKGIDLRQHGSGNLGATNAFRILGKTIGTTVLCIDILKGTVAVIACAMFFYTESRAISQNLYVCLAAIAAVCGHNWTIFLGFKGGKGIATSLGVLIAFSIIVKGLAWVLLLTILLWIAIFLSTGFVSLASIICSVTLPFFALFFKLPKEITVFFGILAVFSVIRHKPNIYKLLQKKENRFDTKKILRKFQK